MFPLRRRLQIARRLAVDPATLQRNRLLVAATYYGGKTALAARYMAEFPEHTTYVEPFGGSGVMLLNKPRRKIEVYNDLEQGVYSLHACLRDGALSEMLVQQLKLTPYSRQEHACCVASYDAPCSLVEKARRWYVATQASYASILGDTFSIAASKSRATEWQRRIDRFEIVTERMRGVTVENRDFETVLRYWDSESTFHFIDPPYVLETRTGGGGYQHELSDSEHLRLLSVVSSLKGDVMLCGYANPLYDEALSGWRVMDTHHRCASGKVSKTSRRIERIWMNYSFEDEATDMSK